MYVQNMITFMYNDVFNYWDGQFIWSCQDINKLSTILSLHGSYHYLINVDIKCPQHEMCIHRSKHEYLLIWHIFINGQLFSFIWNWGADI